MAAQAGIAPEILESLASLVNFPPTENPLAKFVASDFPVTFTSNGTVWIPEGGGGISQPLPFAFGALPNPDTLLPGTCVAIIDECPFVGVVMARPHLEANGSQRFYYRELVGGGYSWKPISRPFLRWQWCRIVASPRPYHPEPLRSPIASVVQI